jgi:hypothetical protein
MHLPFAQKDVIAVFGEDAPAHPRQEAFLGACGLFALYYSI